MAAISNHIDIANMLLIKESTLIKQIGIVSG